MILEKCFQKQWESAMKLAHLVTVDKYSYSIGNTIFFYCSSEDNNNGAPDETPNKDVEGDDIPEENFNNDSAPGNGPDETFEKVDDIHNEDESLEDHLQDNEQLANIQGMDIASEDELISQINKNIFKTTHLMSISSEFPSVRPSKSQPARSTHTC